MPSRLQIRQTGPVYRAMSSVSSSYGTVSYYLCSVASRVILGQKQNTPLPGLSGQRARRQPQQRAVPDLPGPAPNAGAALQSCEAWRMGHTVPWAKHGLSARNKRSTLLEVGAASLRLPIRFASLLSLVLVNVQVSRRRESSQRRGAIRDVASADDSRCAGSASRR
jgi:hypothetical protein